ISEPVSQTDPEAGSSSQNNPVPQIVSESDQDPIIQNNPDTNLGDISDVVQEDIILLNELGLLNKAKSKNFVSEKYIKGGFATQYPIPSGDIIFEEAEVGDPDRPHPTIQDRMSA
ncbi:2557_t:CDS:2, partial [Dentiscutata erythropus]